LNRRCVRGAGVRRAATLLLLFFASIPAAEALDLRLEATGAGSGLTVDAFARDYDGPALLAVLDEGGTIRTTWLVRLDGTEVPHVRYARRDPLGSGYLIYDEDFQPICGPYDSRRLLERLMSLRLSDAVSWLAWDTDEALEVRLYLDRDAGDPQAALRSVFGSAEDRSPWRSVDRSTAESE